MRLHITLSDDRVVEAEYHTPQQQLRLLVHEALLSALARPEGHQSLAPRQQPERATQAQGTAHVR
jgi:hypothetical protein